MNITGRIIELGHLLIGPGHRAAGIMRGPWGRKEFEALNLRQLTFSATERATILSKLRSRAAVSDGTLGNDQHQD